MAGVSHASPSILNLPPGSSPRHSGFKPWWDLPEGWVWGTRMIKCVLISILLREVEKNFFFLVHLEEAKDFPNFFTFPPFIPADITELYRLKSVVCGVWEKYWCYLIQPLSRREEKNKHGIISLAIPSFLPLLASESLAPILRARKWTFC